MKQITSLLSTLFLSALTTNQSYAAEPADDERLLEEVLVTSTYRETKLMETPQAISAISASLIEELGAQSIDDVFTMVPGLSMAGGNSGSNRFTIRGISSQGGNVGYAPVGATEGIYIDGTPLTSALGPDEQLSGTLFDIDRVEVLKGPQGTLFGEGSQSGTIRYLYKQPDPAAVDYALNASYASMEESDDYSHRLDGMLNLPLGENFAVRVATWQSETAGFIENLAPFEKDFNTAESTGVRAALRFESEKFIVTGGIYHTVQETQGGSATFRPYEANFGRITGLPPESKDELDIYSLAIEVDLGWAMLQSQTSYTDRLIHQIDESSAFGAKQLDYFYAGTSLADPSDPVCQATSAFFPCPGFPGALNPPPPIPPTFIGDGRNLEAISALTDSSSERWVQEIRLVSPGENRLRWTLGVFWKDSEDRTDVSNEAGTFPGREAFGVAFAPLLNVAANRHTDFLEEISVFGEVSYDITDALELTVGVRVADLEQKFTNTGTGTNDTPISPKVVLSWQPTDDLLLYGSYATGFRPGNVNNNMEFYVDGQKLIRQATLANPTLSDAERAAAVAAIDQQIALLRSKLFFEGDEVNSYELGVKSTLFDGRVAAVASVYYIDWKDMIVHEITPSIADLNNANSGGAEVQGVEIEVNAFITEHFSVRIAGDLNDTEVTSSATFSTAANGNELIYSPNNSLSVALNYALPIADGWLLDFHVDRAWVSEQFIDSENTVTIPSFQKSNARITLRGPGEKWRVALFANNLENEEIMRGRNILGDLFWQSPRQIGLEFGYHR